MSTYYNDMTHCRACGKIINATPGRRLCHACAQDDAATKHGARPEEEVARRHEKQEALMRAVYLSQPHTHELVPDELRCKRCNKVGRLEGSEFCLPCQVALYHEISKASHESADVVEAKQKHQIKSHRIDRALEEKRSRTTSQRVNLTHRLWKY